jgi:hypothetical protein
VYLFEYSRSYYSIRCDILSVDHTAGDCRIDFETSGAGIRLHWLCCAALLTGYSDDGGSSRQQLIRNSKVRHGTVVSLAYQRRSIQCFQENETQIAQE